MPPHPQSPLPDALFSRAFTLVEISIVISIIGLVIGVIILGKTVARNTQIKTMAVDVQRYTNAALAFQQKYNALPGDFAFATNYWGAMTTAGLTCPPTAGTTNSCGGTLTCNGDGNGQVSPGDNYSGASYAGVDVYEKYTFWQQLANAGLIQGQYTGIPGNASSGANLAGVNIPASSLQQNASFTLNYVGNTASSGFTASGFFTGNYGHTLRIGSHPSGSNTTVVLTVAEAQTFDSKYDDGLPATGNIRTYTNGSTAAPNCATTAVAGTAAYNTSGGFTGSQCALLFITGF